MLAHLAQKLAFATVLIVAGTFTASAVDKLNFDSLSQPSKPAKGLPGVDLSAASRQGQATDDCTQREYRPLYREGFETGGTVTECDYGNLSVRSYRPGSSSLTNNPFPVPEPLRQYGPPPGSGGYAPVQRW